MSRPKSEKNSIGLEQERKRLVQSEDQRRGTIVRECLAGLDADQLRDLLRPFVNKRDAFLIGLESVPVSSERSRKSQPLGTRRGTGEPRLTDSADALQARAAG